MSASISSHSLVRRPGSTQTRLASRGVNFRTLTYADSCKSNARLDSRTTAALQRQGFQSVGGLHRGWWGDAVEEQWSVFLEKSGQVAALVRPSTGRSMNPDEWLIATRLSNGEYVFTASWREPGSYRSQALEARGGMGRIEDDLLGHMTHLQRVWSSRRLMPARIENMGHVIQAFSTYTSGCTPNRVALRHAAVALLMFGVPCAIVTLLALQLLSAAF